MFSKEDYLHYYYLENYIFMTLNNKYAQSHRLNAFDFYCILEWYDSKSALNIKKKLLAQVNKNNPPKRFKANFDNIIKNLTRELYNINDNKEKLKFLIMDWNIKTDLSILILSILYPNDFAFISPETLNLLLKNNNINSLRKFDDIWEVYSKYIKKLKKIAPMHKDLNDKLRWLIGKEKYIKIKNEIK